MPTWPWRARDVRLVIRLRYAGVSQDVSNYILGGASRTSHRPRTPTVFSYAHVQATSQAEFGCVIVPHSGCKA